MVGFVVGLNLNRRHLTDDQKAAVGIAVIELKQAEAKERQREAGRLYGENHPKQEVQTNCTEPLEKGKSHPQVRKQVAEALGVSERKVQDIINISKVTPEKVEQIRSGCLSAL